ncbi:hypothetical protein AB0N05_04540 [Nocardia sp. NPDC051030]|uniref:hypothetical protein n=1 Tax=Nocardia sp. NPDC051030 TaxID=3155162 RepID=UPI00342304D8
MAKVMVRFPDELAEAIRGESHGNMSAWVVKACEDALIRAAVRKELDVERKSPSAFTSHDERDAEMEQFR